MIKNKLELGSEYDLNINSLKVKKNNIYEYLKNYNCYFFNSARNAIKAIPIRKGKVLLPEYICDSVIKCFDLEDIIFYKINKDFEIDVDDILNKIDSVKTVFIMHYFGKLQNKKTLKTIKKVSEEKDITIIEDTTHSLLSSKSEIGDYMITSIRKWLPIPNGGILYTKKSIKNYRKYKQNTNDEKVYPLILKHLYLNNKLDKKIYRDMFIKCEEEIDNNLQILKMSDLCKYMLGCFDLKEIKKIRVDNFQYLKSKLKYNPIIDIEKDECPFVYEIRIDNRDKFRKYLIQNNVYCAIHWPNCSKDELSIPIDNRYQKLELDYLIDIINKY